MGRRVAGADRPLDPRDRLTGLTGLQIEHAHHMQRLGMVRGDRQDLPIHLAGFSEATGAMEPLPSLKKSVDLAARVAHGPEESGGWLRIQALTAASPARKAHDGERPDARAGRADRTIADHHGPCLRFECGI